MTEASAETFDPRRRRLCPDGSCVGIIGADGRCKVCGCEDPEAPRGLGADAFAGGCATPDDDEDAAPNDDTAFAAAAGEGGEGGFNPARTLCPDGACVGVIGPDDRCKVCGRPKEG